MVKIKLYKKYNLVDSDNQLFKVTPKVEQLNKKIEKGEFVFEEVYCLCGSADFDNLSKLDRYGIIQNTVICRNCGLIQSNPRMTEDSYRKFYEKDYYREIYTEGNIAEYTNLKYQQEAGKHIFDAVKGFVQIGPSLKILEIGAGGGWNLDIFVKHGFQVTGLEYSFYLVELGKTHGINMIQGGLEKLQEKYDVIILNHVLEHFLSPIHELGEIKKHLTANGILYIAVPNIKNFGLGQFQNAHAYYFNPVNFRYYTELSGLKMINYGAAESIHMFGIFSNIKNDENSNSNSNPNILKISRRISYKAIGRYRLRNFIKRILNRTIGYK